MPDMNNIKDNAKEKMHEGKEKIDDVKGRLFDNDDDNKKKREENDEAVDIDPYNITKL